MKTKNKIAVGLLALGAGAFVVAGPLGSAGAQMSGEMKMGMMKPSMQMANTTIASWPMDSRKPAQKFLATYGAPDEMTPSTLTWHKRGNWKRIVASRTPIMHLFPGPHPDCVEQFIDYRVPLNKYDDLAKFDGSVNVDRTRGEMSARCDAETHNLLALNLAHDIVTGRRSVADARGFYTRVVKMEKMQMKLHPYELQMMFSPQPGMSHDPDRKTIKP